MKQEKSRQFWKNIAFVFLGIIIGLILMWCLFFVGFIDLLDNMNIQEINVNINESAMVDYMIENYIDTPKRPFVNIQEVENGLIPIS